MTDDGEDDATAAEQRAIALGHTESDVEPEDGGHLTPRHLTVLPLRLRVPPNPYTSSRNLEALRLKTSGITMPRSLTEELTGHRHGRAYIARPAINGVSPSEDLGSQRSDGSDTSDRTTPSPPVGNSVSLADFTEDDRPHAAVIIEILLDLVSATGSTTVPRHLIRDRYLAARPDRGQQVRALYRRIGTTRSVGTRARVDIKAVLAGLERQGVVVRRETHVEVRDVARLKDILKGMATEAGEQAPPD